MGYPWVFILFKKVNLPTGTRKHITLFMWLVWSFCVFGIAAYLIGEYINKNEELSNLINVDSGITNPKSYDINLQCSSSAPGEGSSLAELFEYAESNEGEIVQASITTRDCDCPNQNTNNNPVYDLQAYCDRNPHWWGAKLDLNCVHSLNLVENSHAGLASFCFPKQESLPLIRGYKRSITAVEEHISGKFIVYFEWGLGAPHVQLVVPKT
ncbi:MAG: hypothetical protein GJ680_17565 [Alteromonadaceae bacterium]|nr:hypothetical protein [Alteromonadaceae bacterium]